MKNVCNVYLLFYKYIYWMSVNKEIFYCYY